MGAKKLKDAMSQSETTINLLLGARTVAKSKNDTYLVDLINQTIDLLEDTLLTIENRLEDNDVSN